jgi:glycosyltransferase involved in cell wall biosynthesis
LATPPVTVCVPTYESGRFVRQTLASLVEQSFTDWRCRVIDDCSSDDTFDIANEFAANDSRFFIEQNPKRLGAAGNWNKSIEGVETKYLKLLCSDDILAPTALELTVAALEANPDSTLAATRRDVIDELGRTLWRGRGLWRGAVKLAGGEAMRRFVRSGTNFFGEPSFGLYRTIALQQCGGFDSRWNYLIDVASYQAVLASGSFVPVNASLGAFRVRGESWSASLIGAHARETQAMVRAVGDAAWVHASSSEILIGQARAGINALARRPFFWFAEATARANHAGLS